MKNLWQQCLLLRTTSPPMRTQNSTIATNVYTQAPHTYVAAEPTILHTRILDSIIVLQIITFLNGKTEIVCVCARAHNTQTLIIIFACIVCLFRILFYLLQTNRLRVEEWCLLRQLSEMV